MSIPDYGSRWNVAQDLKAVIFQQAKSRGLFLYDLDVHASASGFMGVNMIRGELVGDVVHEVLDTRQYIRAAFDWERSADPAYLSEIAASILGGYEAG